MSQRPTSRSSNHRPSRRHRRGQALLEYAILAAALLLATVVTVVVLNARIAELVGYSIDVTTYEVSLDDPSTLSINEGILNPSVAMNTLLPTKENDDDELILDAPVTLEQATGIGDVDSLFETELP